MINIEDLRPDSPARPDNKIQIAKNLLLLDSLGFLLDPKYHTGNTIKFLADCTGMDVSFERFFNLFSSEKIYTREHTVAKIRLLEPEIKVPESAQGTQSFKAIDLGRGKFEIIDVITINSEELKPVNLRQIIRLQFEPELSYEAIYKAIEENNRENVSWFEFALRRESQAVNTILNIHIEQGTPGALEIFNAKELEAIIKEGMLSTIARHKLLDYVLQTEILSPDILKEFLGGWGFSKEHKRRISIYLKDR